MNLKSYPLHRTSQMFQRLSSWRWIIAVSAFSGFAHVNAEDPAVTSLPLREKVSSPVSFPLVPGPDLALHIAPNGSDSANGTAARPFATLERARDEVRARRRSATQPTGSIQIVLHGGNYRVSQTFSLAREDSGTNSAPVVFRAAAGERPIFRAGSRVTGWRHLESAAEYPELPQESRSHVWIADLAASGITNLLPLKLGGFASGNGFSTHPAHELFFNGQAMNPARGPNEGFVHIKAVAVKDGTKGYDREGSKTGKFIYEGDQLTRWAKERDLMLYGYWFWDWADSYEKVESIDPENHLITLAQPWHNYGFSVGAPFYAVNALCELDLPGEWYLDRQSKRLVLFAPSDPRQATVELSQLAAPLVELRDVSWVFFQGITWELGAADAIHIRGGEHCLLAGCTVRHCAGNGIEIAGGKTHGLLGCDVYSLGRGGAVISGGERRTLEPGGHFVENCHVYDLSRIDHTYTPAVLLNGVGNRIAHNRMHDIRSSAMRVEGNNHVVEYNEVYNAVTESDDQGAVDMFGNPTFRGNVYRFNYWHHIGNWRALGEQPKCGQAGIRLDDAICGTMIYGNVFERCSAGKLGFGAVQIHGGKDNTIENNLFLNCAAAVSCSPWDLKRWKEFTSKALDSGDVSRELYLQKYPDLTQLPENPNRNHIRHNLAWRCGDFFRRAPGNLDAEDNISLADTEFTWPVAKIELNRPGFSSIPFAEIGLYRDAACRPE